MRELRDETGQVWQATSVDTPVAHIRTGARLAFRPADDAGAEPLLSTVTFNSHKAAELAIRTMSEKELLRRLSLASVGSPGVLNEQGFAIAQDASPDGAESGPESTRIRRD